MKFHWRPRDVALGLVVVGLGAAIYAAWLPFREARYKSSCQSNLKQIGLATMQYTRDYDEKWMLARNWKTSLAPYEKFNRTTNVDRGDVCPKTAIGFAYNIHFNSNRLEAVPNPATIALFYEPAKKVNTDEGQNWATRGIHGDGSNVGFADGHVAWLHLKPIFWSQQLQLKTETLARCAALDQANEWHQYRAALKKRKKKNPNLDGARFAFCIRMKRQIEPTPDGHHVIIDGRKWRATNPNLPEEERKKWVSELMSARRAVGSALKSGDKNAENAARDRVQVAKEALGERGPKWWENDQTTSQSE